MNCNLQRLDGGPRERKDYPGAGRVFSGAGWNVIKVVWGGKWDRLFAKDKSGILLKRMEEVVDGEYQTYKSKNGAYVRQHFSANIRNCWSWSQICRMTKSGIWIAGAMIRIKFLLPMLPLQATEDSLPLFWPRPLRVTAWVRLVKRRILRTSKRSGEGIAQISRPLQYPRDR